MRRNKKSWQPRVLAKYAEKLGEQSKKKRSRGQPPGQLKTIAGVAGARRPKK